MRKHAVSYFDLLRNRDYILLFIGQLISYGGDALSRVALPLYVYQTTGNIHALGGTFALQYIPWVFIGPVAGVIVSGGCGSNTKNLCKTIFYARCCRIRILFQSSFSQCHRRPSYRCSGCGYCRLGGCPDRATFCYMVGCAVFRNKMQIRKDLAEGLSFLLSNSLLVFVILVLILRGLTMIGTFPLYVDFIERVLNKGAFEFGLFTAVASLGYVLSSITTVHLEKKFNPVPMLLISTALSGLLLLPFLVMRTFWVLLSLRFLSALCYGVGNLIANVQIAHLVPSELRGRVNSIVWSFVKLSQAISSSGLSMLAGAWGTPIVIGASGLMLFLGTWVLGIINSQRQAIIKST